jgi:hypothetical protein
MRVCIVRACLFIYIQTPTHYSIKRMCRNNTTYILLYVYEYILGLFLWDSLILLLSLKRPSHQFGKG